MNDLDSKFGPDLERINNWIVEWIQSMHFPPLKFTQGFKVDEERETIENTYIIADLRMKTEFYKEFSEQIFSKDKQHEPLNLARGFLTAHRGELIITLGKNGGTEILVRLRTGDPLKEFRKLNKNPLEFQFINRVIDKVKSWF